MNVKVELTFASVAEAVTFLSGNPQPQSTTAVIDHNITMTHAPLASASAPASADPIAAARTAMTEMMGRFPSGQGAIKTREILGRHSLKRVADATPEIAARLIAEFQAAQSAA